MARRLAHHDLCFGCGQANVFGLQLELEPAEGGGVAGRFFVKQDHQGPPGYAHGGVVAAALDEAMALAVQQEGVYALTTRLEVELRSPAPVGAFAAVEAGVDRRESGRVIASAKVTGEAGELIASATGEFTEMERRPR